MKNDNFFETHFQEYFLSIYFKMLENRIYITILKEIKLLSKWSL